MLYPVNNFLFIFKTHFFMDTNDKNSQTVDKNGAPKNGNIVAATAVTPKPEAKKPEKPEKPKKEETEKDELPPIDDRIYVVEKLFSLIERRTALNDSLKKLAAFKLSTDSNRDELQIRDSKNNTWTTANSTAIAEVVELLKRTLERKVREVESQIIF